jgi:signal transduction histidine kinase/tetratricopeptide (TPR) repeat protein
MENKFVGKMVIKSCVFSLFIIISTVVFSQNTQISQFHYFNTSLSEENIAEAVNYCKDSLITNPEEVKQLLFKIEKYLFTHNSDSSYLCKFYYFKANYFLFVEKFDSAQIYYKKILKNNKPYLNKLKQEIYAKQLFIAVYESNLQEAKKYSDKIVSCKIKNTSPILKGLLLQQQAFNVFEEEDYLQALDIMKQALDKYKESSNDYKMAVVYLYYAKIYTNMGNFPLAIDYLKKADRIFNTENKQISLAYCYLQTGIVYEESTQYDKALKYLQKAESIFLKENINSQLPDVYRYMGVVYNKKNKFKESNLFLSKAVLTAKKQNDSIALVKILQAKGELYSSEKQLKKAVYFYNKAYSIAIKTDSKKLQLPLTLLLSHTYGLLKKYYLAYKYQAIYNTLNESKITNINSVKTKNLTDKYKKEIKDVESGKDILRQKYLELKKEKSRIFFLYNFLIVFLTVITLYLIRYLQKLKKQSKREILEATEKILNLKSKLKNSNNKYINLEKASSKIFAVATKNMWEPYLVLEKMAVQISDSNIINSANADFSKDQLIMAFNLLENVLFWAKLQQGLLELDPESVSATEIIDDILKIQYLRAVAKVVSIKIKNENNVFFYCDKQTIELALKNIIENAMKFSPPKSEIIIDINKISNFVQVKISDNGVGMTKEQINMVLLADNTYLATGTLGEKGIGLGLYIAKEMIKRNFGKINITSSIAQGTTVIIDIPAHS